jgi:pretoxin HINT domain-containing protein
VGSGTLRTTADHAFWSDSAGTWVEASRLGGSQLRTAGGGAATATAVRTYTGNATMYDLTVADIHAYYVGADTKDPVLVHNANPDCPMVLGIHRYSEALKGDLRGYTFNHERYNVEVGEGTVNGAPLMLWMTEVNRVLSENKPVAVALDGFDGLGAGSLDEAKDAFLRAYRNGAGRDWAATEWEMFRIGFYCRTGKLDWSNVKFYIGSGSNRKEIHLPEPIWDLDPTKVRFP